MKDHIRVVEMLRDLAFIALAIILVITFSYITYQGGLGQLPEIQVREIASWYLRHTYNPEARNTWAASPEAVTAIIWDYRGLDTLFETVVFYGAVIGTLTLFRRIVGESDLLESRGMSIIVKRATALVTPVILITAFSTAFHGHLTPGGGFQGGAIASVAPLLLIVVFGKKYFEEKKITYSKLLSARNAALMGICIVPLILPLISLIKGGEAFIFQNQVKDVSTLSYPSFIFETPLGGSLFFFNFFEAIAVSAGFTLVFLTILSSLALMEKELEGKEYGY